MTAPVLALVPAPAAPPVPDREALLLAWRDSVAPQTWAAYYADLKDYARWRGSAGPAEAADELLRLGKPAAEAAVLRYLSSLRERGLSPATVARRRAALRSWVSLAAALGVVAWELAARLPRSERPQAYRDVRGPTLEQIRAMRAVAGRRGGVKGARDVALLGVLVTMGMRRAEVCRLDVRDWDGERLWVVGKGHRDREPLTVAPEVAAELRAYLELRGPVAPTDPLFASCDRRGRDRREAARLSPSGLWRTVRDLARRAGVPFVCSPHRLRHSGTTALLEITGGDRRRVRDWTRHELVATVDVYDDRRRDEAGALTRLLAAAIGPAACEHT